MNPGKVVRPRHAAARLDDHLRLGGHWAPRQPLPLSSTTPTTADSFTQAANRCVGVGKCRQLSHDGGAVMCPSYQATGDERALHAGPRPAAVRDARRPRRRPDQGRLALRPRSGTRSTSAWPARAARPTARPRSTWPPTRRSSSPTTTASRLRPRADYATGWLPARRAARSSGRASRRGVNAGRVHHARCRRLATRAAGLEDRESRRFAAGDLCSAGGSSATDPPARATPTAAGAAVAGHVHQLLPPPCRPGRGRRCSRTPAGRSSIPTEPLCCGLTWISTGQLGPPEAGASTTVTPRAARARRRTGGRPGAELHERCSAPTPPTCFHGDPDVTPARATTPSPSPSCSPSTPTAGSRRGSTPTATRTRSRRCTATSTPCSDGTPTGHLLETGRRRRRAARLRMLRTGRQLRLHRRPRRGQRGLRRAGAAAERCGQADARHRGARRRILLPHPDPPARQRRPRGPSTSPSCSPEAARAATRQPTRPRTTKGARHDDDRRRPAAGATAGMGGRAGLRLPRRRHQRHPRRVLAGRRPAAASSSPGTRR